MWALGARGALGWYPEGLSVQALGTRGELGRHPEGLSARALGTRGTLGRHPEGFSRLELSGCVVYPECSRGIYRLGSLGTRGIGSQMEGSDLLGDLGLGESIGRFWPLNVGSDG